MNTNTFRRILSTFADDPNALDLCRSDVVIQVHNQLIEFQATTRGGQVYVAESGVEELAEKWICKRLANLDLLAQRILDVTNETLEFIEPSGKFVDVLEKSPDGAESNCTSVIEKMRAEITEGCGLSSYVIYLTSDAGEGKTTIVRELARQQAKDYLAKKCDSLVVPIYLGGQPFIKLDDMIIGSIANTYKFRSLYIDTFLELAKIGAIIPAFDGFEEMFVVGSSGEAVSSLGNFVQNLDSMGVAIVSARTAYFEIRDFSAQARLFDSLSDGAVSFSRLKLDRWNKEKFIKYWDIRCLEDGKGVWDTLATKFGSGDHPLLTRAVLIKRLADIAEDETEFNNLIQQIGHNASSYFTALIDSIIERELDKWLDRTEFSVRKPLLSVAQHHELLSEIAVEMAISSKAEMSVDELKTIAELFCDDMQLNPNLSRQVIARLPDHPLLRKSTIGNKSLSFDHVEFKDFFTGEALGHFIKVNSIANFKALARSIGVSNSSIEACFDYLRRSALPILKSVLFIQSTLDGEDPASNIREIGSALIARLVTLTDGSETISISNGTFAPDAFMAVKIENIKFTKCYFYRLDIKASTLKRVDFIDCEIMAIEWDNQTDISESSLSGECKIYEAYDRDNDIAVFSPAEVSNKVVYLGFKYPLSDEYQSDFLEEEKQVIQDEDLTIVERALRAFQRASGVSESVFKVRLGNNYPRFRDHILPKLVDSHILEVKKLRGQESSDGFYHLKIKMSEIESAMIASSGTFSGFAEFIRKQ